MRPSTFPQRACRPQQCGFSLLEALVAMLILAVGILGLVGLQTTMTRAQSTAKFRADAVSIASGMSGAMWTDVANLSRYATGSCSGYAPCKDWNTKAAALLPGGSVAATVVGASGSVNITVGWTTPGESHRYTLATTIVAKDRA